MDGALAGNALLVMVFIAIGGVFAATEMALVSLRESQVRTLAESGGSGAKVAELARHPNTFLSAVQIGVTLSGFFSAAYGAASLAPSVAPLLVRAGMQPRAADTVAVAALTLVIAYLSLVFGELAPKRIAMQFAASVATVTAPPLAWFATAMRPVIWLLSKSTNIVVRMLGGDPHATNKEISALELERMVVLNENLPMRSRAILKDVFQADDRLVREAMRPRTAVQFLHASVTVAEAIAAVRSLSHTRYPVIGRDSDDVLGFVHLRDLMLAPGAVRLHTLARPIAVLPGTLPVMSALGEMRLARQQIALVVDEYGGTDGIITLEDLVEEVVGEIYDEFDVPSSEPEDTVQSRRGLAHEVDGALILQEVERATGLDLPEGDYETVGGFLMARLGKVPIEGDAVEESGYRLTAVKMDGRRVARVLIAPVTPAPQPHVNAG